MKTVSVPAAAPALCPPAAALKLMSDERLARWAAKGSQAAFAVIFERHHQALHRYCQSIVGNGHDAADALQNTMLRAMRALPGETRTIALKPWLYRIAHNESITLLRARRGHSDLDAAAHVGDPGAETIVESRERLRDLTADLGELTEQQRGTLLMRELAGLQFDEISAALQLTATAAKQSVYEARCALQSLEEGRAMDCDVIRRALSDGDRRTLRNLKMRGHLRACAGCRDFEAALHQRPAHLAALTPALPLAAAASILQGLLGAGSGAGYGGGGLLAAIGGGAKSIGGTSLATKVATVAVIAGGAAGGAIYVSPDGPAQRSDSPPVPRESASAANGSVSAVATRSRADDASARTRSTPRSASTGLTSSREAAAADDTAAAGEQARRPAAYPAPMPATSARPRPAPATAPAGGGEVVAGPGARPEGIAGRPQTVPAPAAAPYVPPARPAPAPGTAPVATTAQPAGSAPVTAAPAAAPAASAINLADAVTPPRPR
ncbi:MAG TPA: sigma-70 family RNA polymerase sigma factor [Solirubrobacteraceae bacterium]|nr:sigma-70 family RNA polymerase sigma factor [Solirubrobacteraceae bacterium]